VTRLSEPGRSFLAEHGFSLLVETPDSPRVLFDAGATRHVVPHNLAQLRLDMARDVGLTVLSHGHSDHTGCLDGLRCPIHAHPAALGPRYLFRGGEFRFDLTSRQLPFVRDRLQLASGPTEVSAGVLATGEIPRPLAWEQPRGFRRLHGRHLVDDPVVDDQALVISTRRGLVVAAGCAHAGIINTVRHAQELTGQREVLAIVGGFHLIDADAEKLERSVAALQELEPTLIAPNHCTGFRAMAALAGAFGDRFRYVTAGTRLQL
ncbi:MAG: MBL fold metallo-hydrolase, partial [Armatimonadetes bacterium]|nr:MBL fold metallo-hydrolase [Armatimonadota bacterium]